MRPGRPNTNYATHKPSRSKGSAATVPASLRQLRVQNSAAPDTIESDNSRPTTGCASPLVSRTKETPMSAMEYGDLPSRLHGAACSSEAVQGQRGRPHPESPQASTAKARLGELPHHTQSRLEKLIMFLVGSHCRRLGELEPVETYGREHRKTKNPHTPL